MVEATLLSLKKVIVSDSGRSDTPVASTKEKNEEIQDVKMETVQESLVKHHANLPHWQQGGCIYFVTFRSKRGDLPNSALQEIKQILERERHEECFLHFAVIMPDHVHLLVAPAEIESQIWYSLSKILKTIKGVSSHAINHLLKTSGSVWQKESFDRIIRNEEEYQKFWNYMLYNPVKKGLATSLEDYPFYVTHFK